VSADALLPRTGITAAESKQAIRNVRVIFILPIVSCTRTKLVAEMMATNENVAIDSETCKLFLIPFYLICIRKTQLL
jgi:hypothetical protein